MPNTISNFNPIIAANVIEHSPNPVEFLNDLQSRLSFDDTVAIVRPAVKLPNMEILFTTIFLSLTQHSLAQAACATRLAVGSIKAHFIVNAHPQVVPSALQADPI